MSLQKRSLAAWSPEWQWTDFEVSPVICFGEYELLDCLKYALLVCQRGLASLNSV